MTPEEELGSEEEAEVSGDVVDADFDALIADVKRERDEYLELAQRARADFENFRKRAAREVEEAELRGKSRISRDLIPVVDNLERALASAEESDPLKQGVELVRADLLAALEAAGVATYDPTDEPFDPNLHEALATRPHDGASSGTIIETLERGYRLDGQVIRAARVVVAE